MIFSERELTSTFTFRYISSWSYLSYVCLSITFVHPTQAIEIFGNVFRPFGTLTIPWHPGKILRRWFQANPSVGEG